MHFEASIKVRALDLCHAAICELTPIRNEAVFIVNVEGNAEWIKTGEGPEASLASSVIARRRKQE